MPALVHSDSLHFGTTVRSWWQASARDSGKSTPPLTSQDTADVVIIGAGFTGLSAALRLATTDRAGRIVVLEAGEPGWGASGRNGGFCCLGGSKRSTSDINREFGRDEGRAFHAMQERAINHVHAFGLEHGLQEDFTEPGEMLFAHSERAVRLLREQQDAWQRDVNMPSTFFDRAALQDNGLNASGLYAGLYIDRGFGLHPLNYVRALAKAAVDAGVVIYSHSPLVEWRSDRQGHQLTTPQGHLKAQHVVFATNAYTPEDQVKPLAGKILPVLSNILVTRPLTSAELEAQGWNRTLISYDTPNLLHYFRLLPDGRILFGGRGGINGSNASAAPSLQTLRSDFERLFPAWKHVPQTHAWRGYVCISSSYSPYVGALPDASGASSANTWASLGYHGNGVAMASYCGWTLADLVTGAIKSSDLPQVLTKPLSKFPLPSMRPVWLKARYAGFHVQDHYLERFSS